MAAGDKSRRGIFVTTSLFTKDARDAASSFLDRKMILIDKNELLRLLIDHNIGVVAKKSYIIKGIDENRFSSEDE